MINLPQRTSGWQRHRNRVLRMDPHHPLLAARPGNHAVLLLHLLQGEFYQYNYKLKNHIHILYSSEDCYFYLSHWHYLDSNRRFYRALLKQRNVFFFLFFFLSLEAFKRIKRLIRIARHVLLWYRCTKRGQFPDLINLGRSSRSNKGLPSSFRLWTRILYNSDCTSTCQKISIQRHGWIYILIHILLFIV